MLNLIWVNPCNSLFPLENSRELASFILYLPRSLAQWPALRKDFINVPAGTSECNAARLNYVRV